jgi:flagellar basal-body rod modification protein FlgD
MSYTISKDATYVPTKTTGTSATDTTAADAKTVAGNYQTFLNLLTAQIKNQDPLSPMDTTQWTNQLVQYSSVEQQLKGNQYLAQMAASNSSGSMSSAVNYIGKTVTADVNTATLSSGSASWDYSLGTAADQATLKVLDSSGNIVWTGDAPDMSKGVHSFTWDGKDVNGRAMPNGADYTLSVTAKTSSGTDIDTAVGITGTVTAADSSSGTVMLRIGASEVPLSAVVGVSNPAS